MENILEIIDKTGRKIRLTKKQWSHIRQRHPNIIDPDNIKETLRCPLKILYKEEKTKIYYRYFKHRKKAAKYLKVIVKYLNGEGYVITAYFVRNIL